MNTILSIAHTVVLNHSTAIASSSNTLTGPQLFINESTSAADPTSLGVGCLFYWLVGRACGLDYAGAAQGAIIFSVGRGPTYGGRGYLVGVGCVRLLLGGSGSSHADDTSAGRDRVTPYTWSRPSRLLRDHIPKRQHPLRDVQSE